MRRSTVRLAQNVRAWFGTASLEELYVLARELRVDLERRGLAARPEAAALELALMVELDALERRIYSADCSEDPHADLRAYLLGKGYEISEPPPRIEG